MAEELLGKIVWISPERTNYKPYSPRIQFDDLYVRIPIPDDAVERKALFPEYPDTKVAILTLDGFTTLLDTVATAVDQAHARYMRRVQNGQS
jgi:hypothetical protein